MALGEILLVGGGFLILAIIVIYKLVNGAKEGITHVLNPPPPEPLNIKEPYYFGWSRVFYKKKWLFVNEKGMFLKCGNNPEPVSHQYQASLFDSADDFQSGRSIVCVGNLSALIDSNGKFIIPFDTGVKMRTSIVDVFQNKGCNSIYIYTRERHKIGELYEDFSKEIIRYDGKVLYSEDFNEINYIDAEHFEIVKLLGDHTTLNIDGELELPFHQENETFEDGNVLLRLFSHVALYDKVNKKTIFDFDRNYISLKYYADKKWYVGIRKVYETNQLYYEITTPTTCKKLYYDYIEIYDNYIKASKPLKGKNVVGILDFDFNEIIPPKYNAIFPTRVKGLYLAWNLIDNDSYKELKNRAKFYIVDDKGNEEKLDGYPLAVYGCPFPNVYYNKSDNSILTFEGKVIVPPNNLTIYPVKEDYKSPITAFYRETDGTFEIFYPDGQIKTSQVEPKSPYITDEYGRKHGV